MNTYRENIDFIVSINEEIQLWVNNARQEDSNKNEYSDHWEVVYDLVFNKEVSTKVFNTLRDMNSELNYFDPKSTYKADVEAFADALDKKARMIEKMTRKPSI